MMLQWNLITLYPTYFYRLSDYLMPCQISGRVIQPKTTSTTPLTMSSPPHLPPTFPHPNAFDTLLPHLLPLLPSTLPLVRRIQFHLSSPYATVHATFPPSRAPTAPPPHFSACWVDRTRHPETECWIFSTHETSHNASTSHPITTPEAATAPRAAARAPPRHC